MMTDFEYYSWTKSVAFKYKCPKCGKVVESEKMTPPSPNYAADTQAESECIEEYECVCPHCNNVLNVDLISGMYYGTACVYDLEPKKMLKPILEDEEDETYQSQQTEEADLGFYTTAHKALYDIDSLSQDTKETLYRLLYANVIAYMEAYLCDTLKYLVFHDEDSLRLFVEKCGELGKRKLELKDIYCRKEHLRKEVKEYLDSQLYHKFDKVRKLYKNGLNIDIGNTDAIEGAIAIRHDIVHRNGKTKDGQIRSITKKDVENIWEDVQKLITRINTHKIKKMIGDFVPAEVVTQVVTPKDD